MCVCVRAVIVYFYLAAMASTPGLPARTQALGTLLALSLLAARLGAHSDEWAPIAAKARRWLRAAGADAAAAEAALSGLEATL